jgi:copper transport protein
MMSPSQLDLVTSALRVLVYAGYAMVAGTLVFWALVWPEGQADQRLRRLLRDGVVVCAVASVLLVLVPWSAHGGGFLQAVPREDGVAVLVRVAVLVGLAGFLSDLAAEPVVGRRRTASLAVVVLLALTLVVQSNAVEGGWLLVKVPVTLGHLLATAGWLGGLVALAVVIIPQENVTVLDEVIPRFSTVAFASVVLLVATGAVHAVLVTGGVDALVSSSYGLVLVVKVLLFGAMLALGNHGRRYAHDVTFRRLNSPERIALSPGVHALAVVMGAELATAFAVLGMTAVLVLVAPPGA